MRQFSVIRSTNEQENIKFVLPIAQTVILSQNEHSIVGSLVQWTYARKTNCHCLWIEQLLKSLQLEHGCLSSYLIWRCDEVCMYLFICKCMKVWALYWLLKIGAFNCPTKEIPYPILIRKLRPFLCNEPVAKYVIMVWQQFRLSN